MSEYKPKPGDVAVNVATGARVIRNGNNTFWIEPDRGRAVSIDGQTEVRPLVVIDPESGKDMRRLAECIRFTADDIVFYDLRRALREYANPTPPKPDEPKGLGAVVVDSDGWEWVRVSRSGKCVWWHSEDARTFEWADLDVLGEDHIKSRGWEG